MELLGFLGYDFSPGGRCRCSYVFNFRFTNSFPSLFLPTLPPLPATDALVVLF
jgi:hypothetical protein